ncbi:MAG: hypothetical protein U1F67_00410 [Rubrivivax sp.]
MFAEKSGDACNSFELWAQDLDLVRELGLNSYRLLDRVGRASSRSRGSGRWRCWTTTGA